MGWVPPPVSISMANNAAGQSRLDGAPVLIDAYALWLPPETIAWVKTLTAAQLDLVGRHPALGGRDFGDHA